MYDKEKGIYPAGSYLVGRDLPLGGYIFKAKSGKSGCVTLFANYSDFRNEENELMYQYFDEDIHMSLMEEGNFLQVEDATMQKIS